MILAPGATLGPYRIEREIGRGGMGVVHLARDVRLERAVAIKALPEEFAADPERLARFEREARLLASLHHPNIAGIYGLEDLDGHLYLILEYVEGETLGERLDARALPIADALDVCRQIAIALETAHEAGIVHRDLKPGNVKLTPGGDVKVLDFGLAKGPAGSASSDDLSRSPTLAVAATGMGVILGTAAYMSPEQARGRPVDRRTDIWSFGAVLYECLTGRQCFAGETVSDTIARILQGEPDWKALPARLPASVRHLLRRCLEKDARQRLRDMGDARLELEAAIAAMRSSSGAGAAALPEEERAARGARGRTALLAGIAGGLVGAAVLAAMLALRGHAPAPVVRYPVEFPPAARAAMSGLVEWGDWAVSADGSTIAARIWPRDASPTRQTGPRLWLRRLADADWVPVGGSELAQGRPGFSADGRSLYFGAQVSPDSRDARLMQASVADPGQSIPIADLPLEMGSGGPLPGRRIITIHNDGTRYAVSALGARGPVSWRRIQGANPALVVDTGPLGTAAPLGRDRVFVGTTSYAADGWHRGIAVLDVASGKLTVVTPDGQSPVLLPSGHLLFSRGQTIFAARFDRGALRLGGEPVPLLDGIRARGAWAPGLFRVTDRGDLFYASGGLVGERRELGWVDLAGHMTLVGSEPRAFNSAPVLSPDGRWIVCTVTNARGIDELWRVDVSDRSSERLQAVADADLSAPDISADGRSVLFTRFGAAGNGLYTMPIAGDEDPRPVYLTGASDTLAAGGAWLPGGKRILGVLTSTTNGIVVSFDATGSDPARARPRPALPGWTANTFRLSPSGRWLALVSDRSGRPQVYVCPVSPEGVAGKPVQASRSGTGIGWSKDERRIFIVDSTRVKEVPIAGGVPAGSPRTLYDLGPLTERIAGITFLPDGRAIAAFRAPEEYVLTRIEVIQNWVGSIRDKLPR